MRYFEFSSSWGWGRVTGRGLVWLVLCDTYLEHGGGFVVPVLSAIAALGRTTRNMKSAACTRGRNFETEHVEIMAIFFALDYQVFGGSLGFRYYYTCLVRVRSTLSFSCCFLLGCVYRDTVLRYTSTREEAREYHSFS